MAPAGQPMDRKLAQDIMDGKVEVLGIDEIAQRLGVSRSTVERWVRNGRSTIAGSGSILDQAANMLEGKTRFPAPDFHLGASPKWVKATVVDWLVKNSSK